MPKYYVFLPLNNTIMFSNVYKPFIFRKNRHIYNFYQYQITTNITCEEPLYEIACPPPEIIDISCLCMDVSCSNTFMDVSCVFTPINTPAPISTPKQTDRKTCRFAEQEVESPNSAANEELYDLNDFYMDAIEKRRKQMRRLQPPPAPQQPTIHSIIVTQQYEA